jgi:cytochrome b involved in lipid metabolism
MVAPQENMFSGKDVAAHNTRESCWIIVHGAYFLQSMYDSDGEATEFKLHPAGKVYDVTEFLDGMCCSG